MPCIHVWRSIDELRYQEIQETKWIVYNDPSKNLVRPRLVPCNTEYSSSKARVLQKYRFVIRSRLPEGIVHESFKNTFGNRSDKIISVDFSIGPSDKIRFSDIG